METKQIQTNVFTEGLNTDFHPLNISNTLLTDCINGTIITNSGHEPILQNDIGNLEISEFKLNDKYIPIAVKAWNNIVYVISYNPETRCIEYGSYPSVDRGENIWNTVEDEINIEDLVSTDINIKYSELLNKLSSKNIIIEDLRNEESESTNEWYDVSLDGEVPFLYYKIGDKNIYLGEDATRFDPGTRLCKLQCITPNEATVLLNVNNCYILDSDSEQFVVTASIYIDAKLLCDIEQIKILRNIELEVQVKGLTKKIQNFQIFNNVLSLSETLDVYWTQDSKDIPSSIEIKIVPKLPYLYNNVEHYLEYDNLEIVRNSIIASEIDFGSQLFQYYWTEESVPVEDENGNPYTEQSWKLYVILDDNFSGRFKSGTCVLYSITFKSDGSLYKTEVSRKDLSYPSSGKFVFTLEGMQESYGNSYAFFILECEVISEKRGDDNAKTIFNSLVIRDSKFMNTYNQAYLNYNNMYLNDWISEAKIVSGNANVKIIKIADTITETSISEDQSNIDTLVKYKPIIESDKQLSYDMFLSENKLPHIERKTTYDVDITINAKCMEASPKAQYKITYSLLGENTSIDVPEEALVYGGNEDINVNVKYNESVSGITSIPKESIESITSGVKRNYIKNGELFDMVVDGENAYLLVPFRKKESEEDIEYKKGAIKINGKFEQNKEDLIKVINFLNNHIYTTTEIESAYKYKISKNQENLTELHKESISTNYINIDMSVYAVNIGFISSSDIIKNPKAYGFDRLKSLNIITPNANAFNYEIDYPINILSETPQNIKSLTTYLSDYYYKLPTEEIKNINVDLQYPLITVENSTVSYVDHYPDDYNLDILDNIKFEENKLILQINEKDVEEYDDSSVWKYKLNYNIEIVINDNLNSYYSEGKI